MPKCAECGETLLDHEFGYCMECEDDLADNGYWEEAWYYYEDEGLEE